MIAGTLISVVVAVLAMVFIAAPLLRGDAAEAERISRTLGEASELQSKQEMLLASLRDLEDDRATDKIDEADYLELKSRLSSSAVDVMKRLDELQRRHDERAARPLAPTLPYPASSKPGRDT